MRAISPAEPVFCSLCKSSPRFVSNVGKVSSLCKVARQASDSSTGDKFSPCKSGLSPLAIFFGSRFSLNFVAADEVKVPNYKLSRERERQGDVVDYAYLR